MSAFAYKNNYQRQTILNTQSDITEQSWFEVLTWETVRVSFKLSETFGWESKDLFDNWMFLWNVYNNISGGISGHSKRTQTFGVGFYFLPFLHPKEVLKAKGP